MVAAVTSSREIAILTVGRSDYGRYRSIVRSLSKNPSIRLRLLPTGGHLSPRFGHTVDEISRDGYPWERGLDILLDTESSSGVGKAIGLGCIALSQSFAASRPDLLVVLGDRYEMLCGAAAALGFNIPVVHIHGGAVTEGAIDELIRHALTKMSHLHLVSCEPYAQRVRQMGEEDWRVITVGAPGLDELGELATMSVEAVSDAIGLDLAKPTLLVTYHPVTLEVDRVCNQATNLIEALCKAGIQTVVTYPNADPGALAIISSFEEFARTDQDRVRIFKNMTTSLYVNLMKRCAALVGNSSSGIVEAASFGKPVVNVGTRQDGKLHPPNVITVGYAVEDISAGIQKALSPTFQRSIQGIKNPYGDGKAGERIAQVLGAIPIDEKLLRKRFVDQWNSDRKS
jgi:UDP-hydrolysing UDP-N-acetyl-D-glucosamine 2-epimerase